jgi:hypothetical protein
MVILVNMVTSRNLTGLAVGFATLWGFAGI